MVWYAVRKPSALIFLPGVSEGMQLSMGGKGNAAPRGGMPGDLIILHRRNSA